MSVAAASAGVVSNSRPIDQDPDLLRRLWYADPTGEAAVRSVVALERGDDFTLVDSAGNPVFLIKREVLLDAVVPNLSFTPTRRSPSNIRAHRRDRGAG